MIVLRRHTQDFWNSIVFHFPTSWSTGILASWQRGEQMKTTNWLLVGILSAAPALAQWENVKHTNIPRTADGKPDLSAPVPRAPDGKPDLSGMWWMPNP